MSTIDELLQSSLDLGHHLRPVLEPARAPTDSDEPLPRFDRAWYRAGAAALKSLANAVEDLEIGPTRDDEIDRTMLLESIRGQLARLTMLADGECSLPALPLRHAVAAFDVLLGEDFDADRARALAARLEELPEMLEVLRSDERPAANFLVDTALLILAELGERVELASERLDESDAIVPARQAIDQHRGWLLERERLGGEVGLGDEAVLTRLHLLYHEPLGLRGTIRLLELRRVGAERALLHAATDLGYEQDWPAALEALPELSPLDPFERLDAWLQEWERAGSVYITLGLRVPDAPPGPVPRAVDAATLAVLAMRERARAMFEAARAEQPRGVRRQLLAPGLSRGWGRAVVALLRHTPLLAAPEHLLAAAWLALRDAIAAETDLMLAARMASPDELVERAQTLARFDHDRARALVADVVLQPLESLAAGLAHEGWSAWHADRGGEPAEFLHHALGAGGLAVPLARWVLDSAVDDWEEPEPVLDS